ncbi:hypothetical protein DFS34DRAFT_598832 [Phlyctochytrium arcticum]|nr:hypothetical protein DFS34DRAFT_598832 [Phlyctochytrium arcticum]
MSTLEERKSKWQLKVTRSWSDESDKEQLPEHLADLSIEVYPEAKLDDGQANDASNSAEPPAAIIPAHSIILKENSKYFRALFTNGMAQSLKEDRDGTKPRTVVKIKGYDVPIVKYFLAHLCKNLRTSAIDEDKMSMEDLEQALQIADEFEALSFFDHVSFVVLADYLKADSQNRVVISLLTIAYKYSRETSETLRKGCIVKCKENFRPVLRDQEFKEFLSRHGCRDLCLGLSLEFSDHMLNCRY